MGTSSYHAYIHNICRTRNIPCISPHTEEFLLRTLTNWQYKHCLEIGSAIWYSTSIIASTVKQWWWRVTSFEISMPAYRECLHHIQEQSLSNISLYPFDFWLVDHTRLLAGHTFDFVFLDGRKAHYDIHLAAILPYISSHACLIFDDVIKFENKLSWIYWLLDKLQWEYTTEKLDDDDGIICAFTH